MSKLHINSIIDKNFEPEEGQRDLMCSNKESIRCSSFGNNNLNTDKFIEEELDNISSLCSTLKRIRARLLVEGYSIEDLRKKLYEKENR